MSPSPSCFSVRFHSSSQHKTKKGASPKLDVNNAWVSPITVGTLYRNNMEQLQLGDESAVLKSHQAGKITSSPWHVYCIYVYIYVHTCKSMICSSIPVVPHKAVAEVSEKETYGRLWLL